MNLAAVDSEMIGKTSLASVPRKYYPTLMVVSNKNNSRKPEPLVFEDENGEPTNSVPRSPNDKENFTKLVTNPESINTLTLNNSGEKGETQQAFAEEEEGEEEGEQRETVKSVARSPYVMPLEKSIRTSSISNNSGFSLNKNFGKNDIRNSNTRNTVSSLESMVNSNGTPTGELLPSLPKTKSIQGGSMLDAIKSQSMILQNTLKTMNKN